ncbi:MAG TPA: exosortase-associated EpsI family protein [Phycisphaerae bacterium]|nr:exosortase-associated EpsI family protein [Phycisphaerae bacterium]
MNAMHKMAWLAPVLTLGVLGAMAAQPMFHGKPADADAYHARVRAAQSSVPMDIGDWHGTEVPIPEPAIKLLHPNVIISRRYRNVRTGLSFDLLFTQCEDGRDLAGHYPPNCYPGNGWQVVNRVPAHWDVEDMHIDGMEYEFTKHAGVEQGHIFAADFLIMPDGTFVRDMAGFQRLAYDYHKHYYGAAQIEVVFDGDTLPADRKSGVEMIVAACKPMLDVIRSGSKS